MRRNTKQSAGFSLIELLVVIAIIAILAAILFPVFARVRESTRQATCMTNLKEIYTDVHLYELDNGKYPPILLCNPYIQNAVPPPVQSVYVGVGTPLKAGSVLVRSFSSPTQQKYNSDVTLFQCPDNATNNDTSTVATGAVYPPGVPLAGASPAWYYTFDSYDTGTQINVSGNPVAGVREIHYAVDWTGAVGTNDPKNQLKYGEVAPGDTTVITWCNYHVSTGHSDQIPVLLLNGTAKTVHYSKFVYHDPTHPNGPLFFTP